MILHISASSFLRLSIFVPEEKSSSRLKRKPLAFQAGNVVRVVSPMESLAQRQSVASRPGIEPRTPELFSTLTVVPLQYPEERKWRIGRNSKTYVCYETGSEIVPLSKLGSMTTLL